MTKATTLILGARSEIALAVAHRFAKSGYNIQLAARNAQGLIKEKTDIEQLYEVKVTLHEFDVLNTVSHFDFARQLAPLPDIAVSVIGYMGKQSDNERNPQAASLVMRSNYEGPASIMALLANIFEERGSGCLVGISSVAGVRGRAKNYVYGSAKAGFSTFLSGLRNRLSKKGVHVVTVLPGFIATKMTVDMNLPMKLVAKPDDVAFSVVKAVQKRQDIIYVKPLWRAIMMIVKIIPEKVFKETRI